MIIKTAEEFTLEGRGDKADTGVLVIHGYTSYPGEMRYLAERINRDGYTVSVPRLPGHGTNIPDFLTSAREDWVDCVEKAFDELRRRVEKIHLVGVSMGGLLSIHLAVTKQAESVVLGAPAIINRNRLIYLTPLLRYLLHRLPSEGSDWIADEDMDYINEHYWKWDYPRAAYQFLRTQLLARSEIADFDVPLLLIDTEKDKLVPPAAMEYILRRIKSSHIEKLHLSESSHQVFNGKEREKVAERITEWLNGF